MEEYRKKVKTRIIWQAVLLIAAIVLVVVSYLSVQKIETQAHIASFITGFQTGLFSAWAAVFIFGIVNCARALKNETALKKKYIKEYDERTAEIRRGAQAEAYWISLMGLMIADVIAGFFSETVFFTLLAALLYAGLMGLAAKIYYSQKM